MFYTSLQTVIEVADIAGSDQVKSLIQGSAYVHRQAIESKNKFLVISSPKLKGNDNKVVYSVHSVDSYGSVKSETGLKRLGSLERAISYCESLAK
jgi:hypothetical protein